MPRGRRLHASTAIGHARCVEQVRHVQRAPRSARSARNPKIDRDESIACLQSAAAYANTARTRLRLANAKADTLIQKGKPREAIATLERGLANADREGIPPDSRDSRNGVPRPRARRAAGRQASFRRAAMRIARCCSEVRARTSDRSSIRCSSSRRPSRGPPRATRPSGSFTPPQRSSSRCRLRASMPRSEPRGSPPSMRCSPK